MTRANCWAHGRRQFFELVDVARQLKRRQAALILGETEDMVLEASIGMFSEDGSIRIIDDAFSDDDWAIAKAFTDEGIENLRYIIDAIKDA